MPWWQRPWSAPRVYDVGPTQVLSGFPGNLFVILVGVTYLFALAKNNGTVDWIVHAAVRAVGGRVALIPWAMFVVCAAITAIGAITPAAVAIVAPVALGFGKRFRIHPVLIGILVVMGATGGSFSPIGIFGAITNGVVADSGLPGSPLILFLGCFGAALLISVIVFFAFGGRELLSRKESAEQELETSEYIDRGRRLRRPECDPVDGDRNPAVGDRVDRAGRRRIRASAAAPELRPAGSGSGRGAGRPPAERGRGRSPRPEPTRMTTTS